MSFRNWAETHPKTIQVCKWASIAAFVAWLINMLFYNGSRPWPL
jgi:hypothetical protein